MKGEFILASELTACLPKIAEIVKAKEKGKILIIPTAARGEGWEPAYESHYKPFADMGYEPVEFDLEGKTEREVEDALASAVAIYVTGGNTFYLMKHMAAHRVTIRALVEKGLLYIGSSAGAVIATPDIYYASVVDDISKGGPNVPTSALNLFPMPIMPHLDNPDFQAGIGMVATLLKGSGRDYMIGLKDNQLIHGVDGFFTFVA